MLNRDKAGTSIQDEVISNEQIPEIQELSSGWNSDPKLRPTLSHKDIEYYLLNSSHRTGGKCFATGNLSEATTLKWKLFRVRE